MRLERLYLVGFIMVLAGFVILVAGSSNSASPSAGVVIFVGPVPIIFGSGPHGSQLALISLVASVVIILLSYLWIQVWRLSRSEERDVA